MRNIKTKKEAKGTNEKKRTKTDLSNELDGKENNDQNKPNSSTKKTNSKKNEMKIEHERKSTEEEAKIFINKSECTEIPLDLLKKSQSPLSHALYSRNVGFLKNFARFEKKIRTNELSRLAKQSKVDLLTFLFEIFKKELCFDFLELITLLIGNSRELLFNKKFRIKVEEIIKFLKEYSLEYNKVVYLKKKLKLMKKDRTVENKPLVEFEE